MMYMPLYKLSKLLDTFYKIDGSQMECGPLNIFHIYLEMSKIRLVGTLNRSLYCHLGKFLPHKWYNYHLNQQYLVAHLDKAYNFFDQDFKG